MLHKQVIKLFILLLEMLKYLHHVSDMLLLLLRDLVEDGEGSLVAKDLLGKAASEFLNQNQSSSHPLQVPAVQFRNQAVLLGGYSVCTSMVSNEGRADSFSFLYSNP